MVSGLKPDRAAKARQSFEKRFSDPAERAAYFQDLARAGVAARRRKRRDRVQVVLEVGRLISAARRLESLVAAGGEGRPDA